MDTVMPLEHKIGSWLVYRCEHLYRESLKVLLHFCLKDDETRQDLISHVSGDLYMYSVKPDDVMSVVEALYIDIEHAIIESLVNDNREPLAALMKSEEEIQFGMNARTKREVANSFIGFFQQVMDSCGSSLKGKEKLLEAPFKLHVNFPLSESFFVSKRYYNLIKPLLDKAADDGTIIQYKVLGPFLEITDIEDYTNALERFKDEAQITIYLPSNCADNLEDIANLIHQLNELASSPEFQLTNKTPTVDSEITTDSLLSFRLDYGEDGYYVPAVAVDNEHKELQDAHPYLISVKEQVIRLQEHTNIQRVPDTGL
jgi:hypothetical protein